MPFLPPNQQRHSTEQGGNFPLPPGGATDWSLLSDEVGGEVFAGVALERDPAPVDERVHVALFVGVEVEQAAELALQLVDVVAPLGRHRHDVVELHERVRPQLLAHLAQMFCTT